MLIIKIEGGLLLQRTYWIMEIEAGIVVIDTY